MQLRTFNHWKHKPILKILDPFPSKQDALFMIIVETLIIKVKVYP